MKLEVLVTEQCLHAVETTKAALLAAGSIREDILVDLVVIRRPESLRRYRFAGSPTLLLDGADLFPASRRSDLGPRDYRYDSDGAGLFPGALAIRAAICRARLVSSIASDRVVTGMARHCGLAKSFPA